MNEQLRSFLQLRRRILGLSQKELAHLAGISTGWIGTLEAGNPGKPRDETLKRLATAFTLPGETAGTLFNFLKLILANTLHDDLVHDVASGRAGAYDTMSSAARGIGLPDPDTTNHQQKILGLLRVDLDDAAFHLARETLNYLYQTAIHSSLPILMK